MRNKYIAILLTGVLVANACATLRPTAGNISSPDYNQRVTVSDPGYVKSRSVMSYIVDFGLPIAGAAAGGVLGPVVTANSEGATSSIVGSAVLGALVGSGFTYLSTQVSGYGESKSVTDIRHWLRGVGGKDYIILYWDGRNYLRVIDSAAEANYTVRNMGDVDDFVKAFPDSRYASNVVEQAIPVCKNSSESLAKLERLFPNVDNLEKVRFAYLQSCTSFSQLDDYLNQHPDLRSSAESAYANAVGSVSEALTFHSRYPSSSWDATAFRNAFRNNRCSQADALKLYNAFGYDAALAAAGGNMENQHARRLAEGLYMVSDSDRQEKNWDERRWSMVRKSADLGYSQAQYLMGGYLYMNDTSLDTAIRYLENAAEGGVDDAARLLTIIKGEGGKKPDHAGFMKWLAFLADKGDIKSQFTLSLLSYENKNGAEYVKWTQRFLNEHKESEIRSLLEPEELAYFYWEYGEELYYAHMKNTPQSKSEGEKWIRKAAALNMTAAQEWCAMNGTKDDRIRFYRAKANQGDPDAMVEYALRLPSSEAKEKESWLNRASKAGNLRAKNYLGNLYFNGDILKRDLSKALSLSKEVVSLTGPSATGTNAQLYKRAITRAGAVLYETNKYSDCIKWFKSNGCYSGQDYYYKGISHKKLKQYSEAFASFQAGHEKHYLGCGIELAYCYVYGNGVTEDLNKADRIADEVRVFLPWTTEFDTDEVLIDRARLEALDEAISKARKGK